MKIERTKVVAIHYTLKDKDGTVIDSSREAGPLEYMHGFSQLIPGLERELEGKEPGDAFSTVISPADGYGEYNAALVAEVPRSQFDADSPIEVGQAFTAQTATGSMTVRVTKVTDDTITVDGNHELAGQTLYFDVEVVNVRDATDDELSPAEDEGGCGGSCASCGSGCAGCAGCGL